MRLPASEKLEIIRLVEQSHLPARRTLKMLGIKPSTFYRCSCNSATASNTSAKHGICTADSGTCGCSTSGTKIVVALAVG